MSAKFFDHAVLPVESLEVSRERYQALGFTVAADARHPFGTENACVFFSDDTYLEPLGIAQREDCEATATKGNVFTKLDQTYRFRVGQDGFSAVAFKTNDADADHKTFQKLGISAGKKLSFGRNFVDGNGKKERASFKLSFARDDRAPDATFFTCERINTPNVDRSSLTSHANGVTGIKEIILSEFVPSDFQYFLQPVIGNRDTPSHSFGMEITSANVNFNVLTPEGLTAMFGATRQTLDRGLRLEGIVFAADKSALLAALKQGNIEYRDSGRYIIVPAANGQGAFFAFEGN
ncbi:VOC family protein [Ahrensia sp. 13_GOM-1096m]|uniref:VOC family protein n=1 Tax=Ahrensia sp. 13_GOM-1096m TaxID=1380380 RepID=UPI00047C20EE|nr:VOC family protein [Ahrensia sp. 13_GOM-1096m]